MRLCVLRVLTICEGDVRIISHYEQPEQHKLMFMIVSLFGRLGDVCVTKTDAAACELLVVVVVKAFSWRRKKHASRERYRVETVICGSERGSKG